MYQQICSSILSVVFLFCWRFPLLCRNFLVWWSSISLLFLLFPLPGETYPIKNFYEQCLRFCRLCFFLGLLWFGSNVQVFDSFWICFCVWCNKVVYCQYSACICPIFPTRCIEKTTFSPLYVLVSSVEY